MQMTDIVYSYLNCTTKYQKNVNWQRKIDLIIPLVQVSIQICWKCFGCQPLCNNSKTITYLTISYHHKESKLPARHFGLHKWSQTTLKHCQLNIWWELQYNVLTMMYLPVISKSVFRYKKVPFYSTNIDNVSFYGKFIDIDIDAQY